MDLINDIKKVKKEVLLRLKEATEKGNSNLIINLARIIEDIDNIESQLRELSGKISNIENTLKQTPDTKHETTGLREGDKKFQYDNISKSVELQQTPEIDYLLGKLTPDEREVLLSAFTTKDAIRHNRGMVSSKMKGNEERRAFVKLLDSKGIKLAKRHGVIYEDQKGRLYAIAYAKCISSKWFLGVPDGPYDFVILLCKEENNGDTFSVILPKPFLDRNWKYLSLSQDQVKFNIRRTGRTIIIYIPGMESESIDKYIGNYELLR